MRDPNLICRLSFENFHRYLEYDCKRVALYAARVPARTVKREILLPRMQLNLEPTRAEGEKREL